MANLIDGSAANGTAPHSTEQGGRQAATRLCAVPYEDIAGHWATARPFIERALEHDGGRRAPEDILEKLRTQHMQLWAAVGDGAKIEAILISEIIRYPQHKRLSFFLAAGNVLEACVDHLAEIEAIAKEAGCDFIEASGRPGWERRLPGFRRSCVLLEKRI